MQTLYLVPTRGRPDNALRLVKAWHTTTTGDTRLQLCLDDDDPELARYEELLRTPDLDGHRFGYVVGPRLRLGPTLNHYATYAMDTYDAIGFMGDDHLPRTPGWDRELADSLRPFGVAYGNDLIQGPALPTAVLLDARLVRAMGFMCPPGLVHMYLDNFWRHLGVAMGTLAYRPDVVIEHLHPIAGKSEWDDRYREVNDGGVYAADEAAYAEFMEGDAWTKTLASLHFARAAHTVATS